MTSAAPIGPRPGVDLEPSIARIALPWAAAGPIYGVVEALFLGVSPYLGSLVYHAVATPTYAPPDHLMLTVGFVMAGLYMLMPHPRGMFDLDALRSVSLRGPLVRWALAFLCFTWASFALKIGDVFSRGGIMMGFLIGASGIILFRLAVPFTVNMAFYYRLLEGRRAIVISDGLSQSVTAADRESLSGAGLSLQAWLRLPEPVEGAATNALARFVADVVDIARLQRVEEILVVADAFRQSALAPLLESLRILPLRIRIVPRSATVGRGHRRRTLSEMAIEVQTPPFSRAERLVKRCLDVTLALALIVLLSPLLVAIAITIRLDSRGPVLFRQTRIGFCGRPFLIYKFRSMHTTENGPVVKQAERGDARVTKFGSFLRRNSLDELPQLLNVVVGDMSLVGPRPHAMAHDKHYEPLIDDYAWRYHALPGITGWAQVTGYRGETPTLASMEGRVERDLWYIRNWSIWLDVKILFMTIGAVLRPTNAY